MMGMARGIRSIAAFVAVSGIVALLVSYGVVGAGEGPPTSAERPLRDAVWGRWVQLERIVDGRVLDDPAGVTVAFTNRAFANRGMLEWRAPDGVLVRNVHFELDETVTPMKIDCWGRSDRSDLERGILRVDGKRMLLAFSRSGAERPLRFESVDKPGDAWLAYELGRSRGR
jgi:hypothetical protein